MPLLHCDSCTVDVATDTKKASSCADMFAKSALYCGFVDRSFDSVGSASKLNSIVPLKTEPFSFGHCPSECDDVIRRAHVSRKRTQLADRFEQTDSR